MSAESVSRRSFLAASGTGLGAAWLAANPDDVRAALAHAGAARQALARGQPLPPFQALTPEQAADIETVAAQIMPTDDLPGAREARVVNFLDHSLTSWGRDQRAPLLDGLAEFNSAVSRRYDGVVRFALLTADQQLEFLGANQLNFFFQQMIFVTVAGSFAHPDWGGNYGKAGWRILGFEDRYLWQPPFGWYDARANGGPN